MDIIKRLPSHLAQRVFSFDDTYHKLYRVVIAQLMYYQLFTWNTIFNLNKYKTAQYTLNKRRKITCAIKEFIQKTNKEFDINMINMFRNDMFLHEMYKPNNCGYKWILGDSIPYSDFLSFKKYHCVAHFREFSLGKSFYDNLITLALILNGFRYKHKVTRDTKYICLYGRRTKNLQEMYDLGFKCRCASVK